MDLAFLTLPKGFKIHKDGGIKTINEVPKNALELIEEGCTWLILKKDAATTISKWSIDRIQKLLDLRAKQGFKHDVEVLKNALELKLKAKEEKSAK